MRQHVFYRIRRWHSVGGGYRTLRWALLRQSAPDAEAWIDWISERERSDVFDLEEALSTIDEFELKAATIKFWRGTVMTLSALKVEKAIRPQDKKKLMLSDGDGLFLRVRQNGSKHWFFRFTFGGKVRECLGAY
jgi:hypothetical protein